MGAPDSVDDELESFALAQHRLKVAGLARRQLAFMAEGGVEERREAVNPCLLEGWEELVEAFRAQARERLEHAGMAGKLVVANHSSFCVDGAIAS